MNKFYLPSVKLMDRLKYPQKFLVISLSFLVLITVLIYIVISNLNRQIEFTERELIGAEYIQPVMELIINLEQHRGVTYGYLNGAADFKDEITQEELQIRNNINQINTVNNKYGSLLNTTDKWKSINKQWQDLLAKSLYLSPEENFAYHTRIIDNVFSLISYIGITSNLVLDPEVTTYYLMDSITTRTPIVIESMAKARGLGTGIATKKLITQSERIQLTILYGLIIYTYNNMLNGIDIILDTEPEFKTKLNPYIQKSKTEFNEFINLLNTELIKATIIDINPFRYFTEGDEAVLSTFRLYNSLITLLEQELNNRLDSLLTYKYLLLAATILSILLVIYLYYGFYLSLMNNINNFRNTFNSLTKGDLKARVNISTNDEVVALADSMNYTISNLERLFNRQKSLKDIVETIRESLDINEALKIICDETAKLFNADRAVIIEFPKAGNYKCWTTRREYLKSELVKCSKEVNFDSRVGDYWGKNVLEKSQSIAVNNIKASNCPEFLKYSYEQIGVNSVIFIPIRKENYKWGLLGLSTIESRDWADDDINVLEIIATQIYIAIRQAELFSATKKLADTEELLRSIINEFLTSDTIEKALDNITVETGRVFDADRVVVRQFNQVSCSFREVLAEFTRNENIPSEKGYAYPNEVDKFLYQQLFEKKELIISYEINNSELPELIKTKLMELGIESIIIAPIIYRETLLGAISISNTEQVKALRRDIVSTLILITKQIAIGINLFQASEKLKKYLDGERVLRDILLKARTLDHQDKIYNLMLAESAKLFTVERVLHLHYDNECNLTVFNAHIAGSATSIDPLLGKQVLKAEHTQELTPRTINDSVVVNDAAAEINDVDLKKYLLENNIKSFLIYPKSPRYPEKAREKVIAITMLCSSSPRSWTNEEIDLFRLIVDTNSIILFEFLQRKETEETRNTFLATLTHDLRSPINAEQKALEAIMAGKLGNTLAEYSEYLEDIYKTNEELLRIVNNILMTYHYESGKAELKLEPAIIADLVNDSVRIIRPLASDQNSQINTDIQENLPLILLDPGEISRVINNLISNAIKHNTKGTTINVGVIKTDNTVQVSVQDNGKGIPESEKQNIFQRYPTQKRKIGTGLGLYLSKQIIDAHKGKIWFETEQGKGTTFYFSLPILLKK